MSSHNGKHPPRESACMGKSPFGSHKLAAEAAKRMRGRDGHCNVEPYHCAHCGLYHCGSSHRKRKPYIIQAMRDAESD